MGKITEIDVKEMNGKIEKNALSYIKECEEIYHMQIDETINKILKNPEIKFILLAGPSSAGKTTTAKLIKEKLEQRDINAKTISLDDFFVERKDTPLWPDGKPNYESIDAVDWQLFDKCVKSMLEKKYSIIPTYDFILGTKKFENYVTLAENDIIIFEGLHCLNKIIDNFISKEFSAKIYLSPQASFQINGEEIMNGVELRFFRRLIRDVYTRGSGPEKTLKNWMSVREGERLYIDPFKNNGNFVINSIHPYEVCIYKKIIRDLKIDKLEGFSELTKPFDSFVELEKKSVPENSLLQEFVH